MKSRAADAERAAEQRAMERLSPAERVALALRLGRESRERYAAAHGITVAEACRRIDADTAAGRRR
jgi:hypothetical protein